MNAVSLFVSTNKLVLQANVDDPTSWSDLYRLLPYLRQALSCTVCGNLLLEPYTPVETDCQHNVCRLCIGGRKILKPSCILCKDYNKYAENTKLRTLLQSYKKICGYIISIGMFRKIISARTMFNIANSSLAELIEEGANFKDEFKSTAGLSKSDLSILPSIYTSEFLHRPTENKILYPDIPNGATRGIKTIRPVHSKFLHNGVSKLPVRRKSHLDQISFKSNGFGSKPKNLCTQKHRPASTLNLKSTQKYRSASAAIPAENAKKTSLQSSLNKKKGCRCGNATAAPGKLTCCGQRCPCYVESKACTECRCRGCRNPHRPDGQKVRPVIPALGGYYVSASGMPSMASEDSGLDSANAAHSFSSVDTSDLPENTLPLFEVYPTLSQPMQNTLFVPEDMGFTGNTCDIDDIDIDIDI